MYNKFTKLKPREYLIDLNKLTHLLVTCFANFAGSDIKLGTGALHDNFCRCAYELHVQDNPVSDTKL